MSGAQSVEPSPLIPFQEKALVAAAMTTEHSAAIVSMRTNRVLATNSNIGKWEFSNPVDWPNFYIVPLWQEPGSTEIIQEVDFLKNPECMPAELQKLYSYLLRDKVVRSIEYKAHTGVKEGTSLRPGTWSAFTAEAYLIEHFYGEPARLVITTSQESL